MTAAARAVDVAMARHCVKKKYKKNAGAKYARAVDVASAGASRGVFLGRRRLTLRRRGLMLRPRAAGASRGELGKNASSIYFSMVYSQNKFFINL